MPQQRNRQYSPRHPSAPSELSIDEASPHFWLAPRGMLHVEARSLPKRRQRFLYGAASRTLRPLRDEVELRGGADRRSRIFRSAIPRFWGVKGRERGLDVCSKSGAQLFIMD